MPEFLRPRLVGTRFDDGAIPLEMLNDLSVLGDMVVEVAKWLYLQAHPDRKRSPRGFTEGVSFRLTGVEKGSATPVIDLELRTPVMPRSPEMPGTPGKFEQYFLEARDAIIDAISAAERDELTPDLLPPSCFGYFDRLGRRLQDDEFIEFAAPNGSTSPRLSRESRRRLVLASSITEPTEEVWIWGYVPEADQDRMSFELQLVTGRKIRGDIPGEHLDTIVEAFTAYKEQGKVLIRGIGKCDRRGRLTSLDSIEHIALLDPLDIVARLGELGQMEDGWLDGEGVAPSSELLDWLTERFKRQYPQELLLPHVYPTPEGGVQAEWSIPPLEITLRISPDTRDGEWHLLDTDTDEESERKLSLSNDDDWSWLAAQIYSLSESSE